MTPERERDKRLAEWIGYEQVQEGHRYYWFNPAACGWKVAQGPPSKTDGAFPDEPALIYRHPADYWEEVPHFSEDIAAAFQVVEFVRARGYCYEIDSHEMGWSVRVCRLNDETRNQEEAADEFAATLPEAICRAAVAVMEAEKAQEEITDTEAAHRAIVAREGSL
ncbi:MAG: hypothetical protein ACE15C_20030 [Phycisphaerae bacterium]